MASSWEQRNGNQQLREEANKQCYLKETLFQLFSCPYLMCRTPGMKLSSFLLHLELAFQWWEWRWIVPALHVKDTHIPLSGSIKALFSKLLLWLSFSGFSDINIPLLCVSTTAFHHEHHTNIIWQSVAFNIGTLSIMINVFPCVKHKFIWHNLWVLLVYQMIFDMHVLILPNFVSALRFLHIWLFFIYHYSWVITVFHFCFHLELKP